MCQQHTVGIQCLVQWVLYLGRCLSSRHAGKWGFITVFLRSICSNPWFLIRWCPAVPITVKCVATSLLSQSARPIPCSLDCQPPKMLHSMFKAFARLWPWMAVTLVSSPPVEGFHNAIFYPPMLSSVQACRTWTNVHPSKPCVKQHRLSPFVPPVGLPILHPVWSCTSTRVFMNMFCLSHGSQRITGNTLARGSPSSSSPFSTKVSVSFEAIVRHTGYWAPIRNTRGGDCLEKTVSACKEKKLDNVYGRSSVSLTVFFLSFFYPCRIFCLETYKDRYYETGFHIHRIHYILCSDVDHHDIQYWAVLCRCYRLGCWHILLWSPPKSGRSSWGWQIGWLRFMPIISQRPWSKRKTLCNRVCLDCIIFIYISYIYSHMPIIHPYSFLPIP